MVIHLKGVKNVRDFSEYGYENYIRSAHLNVLTPEDAELLLQRYHLKTIVDLRTSQEVSEKPDVCISGVDYMHIPIFDEVMPGISHEEKTDELQNKLPDMPRLYRELVTEPVYLDQIDKVMRTILNPEREGAILWHCTEGKDRCGIISALFLLSRGVDRELVMKDYLRTNRVNYFKAWKYFLLILLSRQGLTFAKKVRGAFLASRDYMEPIMDILQTRSEKYQ